MKKVLILVLAFISAVTVQAQQKPKPKPKPKTAVTAAPQPALKTSLDSLSYALGLSLAEFYKQQGIKTVNTTLVSRAINDAMKGGKPLLNEEQMNSSITGYLQKVKSEKSAVARKAGE